MEQEIYTLYDAAKNKYSSPIFADNDATAMRDFAHECTFENSIFSTHPQDFTLYHIGTFYPLTGEIIAFQTHERVCSANDFSNIK